MLPLIADPTLTVDGAASLLILVAVVAAVIAYILVRRR